jgi:type I restriction enzyme S subunit
MRHTVPLPRGWAEAALDDVVAPRVEQRPPSREVPYIDISSIDRETKSIGELTRVDAASAPTRARQWVRHGDVLVSMTRPNLNAVAIVPQKLDGAVASTGFDVLRAVGVLPEWVFNRVRSQAFVAGVCENLQGVVYPAIRPRDVRAHQFPIPPLAEQDRIVESIESYLTRLDNAVALLERVEQNLKRYRASVLKAAVEGRLVPTEAELARREGRELEPASDLLKRILAERKTRWIEDAAEKARAKAEEKARKAGQPWTAKDDAATLERERGKAANQYKEPAAPDTTDLPDLPEGWCWTSVEMLAKDPERSICAGPFGTIFKARDFRDEGVPIIFLRHVKPDEYRTAKPTYMDHDTWVRLFQDYSVGGGELLVTKLGDPPGECAIYPRTVGVAMLTPDVMKLEVNTELTVARFVMHYLNSDVARRLAFGMAFGTTRLRLTLPLFRALPVPLPPLSEQLRVAAHVDERLTLARHEEAVVQAVRTRGSRLRQATLKWAFEGKLVEQDPSDEPAGALLERIRAERATAGAPKARGRKKRSAN